MPGLPSGTVTFLFTDIEGSTRLLEEHGDGYATLLDEHRRVVREACARQGGVEVDTQGDAFFVAFSSASAAVEAAAEAQTALAVPVRMGIHTGEPALTAEGYVGMDVHRAARICAAAHGRQVVLSETTAGLLDDAPLRDLGEHRLKDLGAPLRLYQLGEGDFPPLRSLNQTNLPAQPSELVGRERELAELAELLRRDRLVTLTGPGGSGKTRLALQAAAELVDDFSGGVFFVPLAAVADPTLVLPTVGQTIGARDGVAEHIGDHELLLLLDNLEQVVEAAPHLAQLLERCSNVRLLVTSRTLLRIAGERDYPVDPLPETDAVQLFRERAAVSEPREAVHAICRRLDGLPLAVELAAARTRLLPPEQLLERLEHALPLLTGGRRDAPARQRTLRATIEWSYELLDDEERTLFGRLSVFAGSFTVEAAEEVCGAELDTLESLVEKSLVRRWASGRLGMLETIREFARGRLDESGEGDRVRHAHAEGLVRLLESAGPHLGGADQLSWLRRLDEELGNLRAALEFADATDSDLLLRLTAPRAFGGYMGTRGYVREGRDWAERALSRSSGSGKSWRGAVCSAAWLAQLQGDVPAIRRLAGAALADAEREGDADDTAFLLRRLAATASSYEESARMWERTTALAREMGDRSGLAASLTNLGDLELRESHIERALELNEEALTLYLEVGRPDGAMVARQNLAFSVFASGQLGRAADLFRESLVQASQLGDVRSIEDGLIGLAAIAAERLGDPERAARLLGASARIREEAELWLGPLEEGVYQRTMEQLRAELDPEALDAALAEGRRLESPEAVEYALAEID